MAASGSVSHSISGQVDGKSCTFFLKEGSRQLSWIEGEEQGLPQNPEGKNTIPSENIICALPPDSLAGSTDECRLLYVIDNLASSNGDSKASPVALQSATLTCSRSVLHGFPQPAHDVHKPDHVVVSTGSGTGLAQNVWKDLVKPTLDALSISEYQIHLTQSESSVAELAQDVLLPRANEGKNQTVMLLSGDGGILDVVNSLLSGERSEGYRKPSIAVLPLGTGNALANSSGIAADNTYGLRSWLQGSLKELPLYAAAFSDGARILFDEARQEKPLHLRNGVPIAHGAVVCSWGLHAALVADSDTQEYRTFGAERFKMAAKEALFPSDGSVPHAYKGNVSILRAGQKEWEVVRKGEHGYILATPVSQLEKGFTISPSSKPLNEKLRLVHFGPVSGEAAMEIMTKAYQGGQHVQDARVGYDEIDALRIEFREEDGRWRRICIDGKIVRVERGGWVEVRAGQKGVLDLIVP